MYRKGNRTTGKRHLKLCLLVIMVTMSAPVMAAPSFTFLQIGVGAREGAMGGTGAAISSGPSAAYFNPANLTHAKRGGALLMLNRHFADITSQYLAVTMRRGSWAITPHYLGTTVPGIELRDRPTRDPVALFDSRNAALGVSVAREFYASLSVGATVNYLYEKIYKEASDGWGFDFGVSLATPVSGLRLGAAVQNLGKASKFVAEAPDLPTLLRGGVAFTKSLGRFGEATVAADWLSIRDMSPEQRFGLELSTLTILRIRGGFISGVEALDATAGFGLYYRGLQFDYAYIPFREELGEGHRFAFGVEL
jgi:hypothetical protein